MHTGITGITNTLFGGPYTVYQQNTSTHSQHLHNIQQQLITTTHKQLRIVHQTIHKHCQTRTTQDKLSINRAIQKRQGYTITLTTTQVQEAIKQSINNNTHGPDKLNIRRLNT